MNLIMVSELIEPPSDSSMVRYLTMIVNTNLDADVLVETQKEMIDLYFHYMKRKGLMDYISDILPRPTFEDGIRLDTELNYPRTIQVEAITFNNIFNILGQIGVIKNF